MGLKPHECRPCSTVHVVLVKFLLFWRKFCDRVFYYYVELELRTKVLQTSLYFVMTLLQVNKFSYCSKIDVPPSIFIQTFKNSLVTNKRQRVDEHRSLLELFIAAKKNRNMHSLCFHCFLIVGSGSFYCSVCQVCLKTGHQRYTQSWQWKSILMSSKPNDGLPIIYNGFLNSTLIMCTIKNAPNINNFVFEVFQRCLPNCTFCSSLELTV